MIPSPRTSRLTPLVCSVCAMLAVLSGCSRSFWRNQADRDSYELISEKMFDEAWQLPRMDVTPDPRSRFYDPFDPDWEPLPPDDPAAHQFMHEVGSWTGYKNWHEFGRAFSAENPHWIANLTASANSPEDIPEEQKEQAREDNPFYQEEVILQTSAAGIIPQPAALRNLDLAQLIELAYIHNRDYQFAIEGVFLQALNVSQQRFNFGVRYLPQPSINLTRLWRPGEGPGRDERLTADSTVFGLTQALPSGAQWAIELTNNTLWVFSGGNPSRSASNLSWSIVQPLLRNAGRKIGLENLTQAERRLLYEVRDLARFRKTFFFNVTSGYLNLLNQVQNISNQRDNLQRLRQQIEISKVLLSRGQTEGERLYDQQTIQLESRLTRAVNALRTAEVRLQDSYDDYKINRLGLPPDLSFSIDMKLLDKFQLIDPRTLQLEDRARVFQEEIWGELKARQDQNMDLPDEEYRRRAKLLRELFDEVIDVVIGGIEQDFERVEVVKEKRLSRLSPEDQERFLGDIARDAELFMKGKRVLLGAREVPFTPAEKEDMTPEELEKGEAELGIAERLNIIETLLENSPLTAEQKTEIYTIGTKVNEELYKTIQNLDVVQVNQRVETVVLQPFDMSMEEVIQLALENRLDLQNARAILVDARRQVEIAANDLKAVLDLTAQGDIGTPGNGDNPLDFRRDQSSYQVGVQFTTPLNLQMARNNYRQSQIAYQRARRAYMLAEDQVKRAVREHWRQLVILEQNFETSRQSVRYAAIQLDIAVEENYLQTLQEQQIGGRVQTQGLNLLDALQNVLDSQNGFIGNWVSYEQRRINIYLDMGIMQVDDQGVWEDDYYQNLIYSPEENPKNPLDPPQMYQIPESELQLEIPGEISALPDRIDSKVLPALGLELEGQPTRMLPPSPEPMAPESTTTQTQPRKGLPGGLSSSQVINPFQQEGYEEFRNDRTRRQIDSDRKPIVLDDWESVDEK